MPSLQPLSGKSVRSPRGAAFVLAVMVAGGWAAGSALAPRNQVQLGRGGTPLRLSTNTFADWPLADLDTGAPVSASTSKAYVLYIVLAAGDCSSCLLETMQWNTLAQKHAAQLDVRGIVINSSPGEAREYTSGFQASFPVFLGRDPGGTVLRDFEGLTPIKVLVDRHRRPLLAETGGSPTNAFDQRVAEVIAGRR